MLQENSRAPATVQTRSSQLRAFDRFRLEMAVVNEPPLPRDMVLFASWLMLYHCTREASLRQYLSAVKTFYSEKGFFVPAPSDFGPLKAVVDGSRRLFPGPSRKSKPVTIQILRNLVFSNPPPGASWRLAMTLRVLKDTCLVLYFSMLRSSSLFPPWRGAADKNRNMIWDRVQFFEGGAKIIVILAKTQQNFSRTHEVVLREKLGSPFCPVAALRRLRSMSGRRADGQDFVFKLPVGDSAAGAWRLLIKSDLCTWFKRRVSQMNLDSELYMLHGFRHGAVALAVSEEPNLSLVKLASDQSSNIIWEYAQVDASRRQSVATAMIEAVHQAGTAPVQQ